MEGQETHSAPVQSTTIIVHRLWNPELIYLCNWVTRVGLDCATELPSDILGASWMHLMWLPVECPIRSGSLWPLYPCIDFCSPTSFWTSGKSVKRLMPHMYQRDVTDVMDLLVCVGGMFLGKEKQAWVYRDTFLSEAEAGCCMGTHANFWANNCLASIPGLVEQPSLQTFTNTVEGCIHEIAACEASVPVRKQVTVGCGTWNIEEA